MSVIDEKTKVPLAWGMTVMASLIGIVATAATAHYRIGALETRADAAEIRMEKQRDQSVDTDKRMQRVEDQLEDIKKMTRRIERKIFNEHE